MLGAGHGRIMLRHILPNAHRPFIVVLTILLGASSPPRRRCPSSASASRRDAISWGIDDLRGRLYMRTAPHPLICARRSSWRSTVLAFIMLGDAVRDAFDPKLR